MRGRCPQLLQRLGLLLGLLCLLAGCGGSSDNTHGTAARGRQLSLQLQLSSQAVTMSQHEGLASAQVRQVQPGDPGFIERLEIRLQAQGSDLAPPQIFTLSPTEQETVTLNVTVPETAPATFQVLVSSFNSQGIEVFRGDTSVALGQTSAIVPLIRTALVPVPATPANLQQTTFTFTDGAIFRLPNVPVTLATGSFVGNVGDFALTASGFVATGSVAIGSCNFVVATSTFPPGQGLQMGDLLVLDPCQIDAIDRRLIATNATVSLTPVTSSPPVPPTSDTTLNLPAPPTLVLDEDTAGTLQVTASVSGTRSGNLTLSLTVLPANGTATLDTNTGIVTYTPVRDFNGSDRTVVTVVVTFTDNNTPALLLGTVLIPITVRSVQEAPVLLSPGNQIAAEGATVALSISARDVDGDVLSFSATNLPPGLSINATTGIISGTIASGAALGSPYNVTLQVSDGVAPPLSISFVWTVLPSQIPLNPNTVRIFSPPGPVPAGATFSVPVEVNTGATNVLSYLFELGFDPNVVVVTNVIQGSPFFEVPITNPAAFTSGTVRFAANNLTPTLTPASGMLILATITFQIIGSPGMTSPLTLGFPLLPNGGMGALVDSNFQAIGGITFASGSVTVN
jgi:Putative Ig domain/Cohesin domain